MGRPSLVRVPSLFKMCPGCKEQKPPSEFGVVKSNWDGRRHKCKKCYWEIRRKWSARNRDRIRLTKKREYEKNRDKYLEYMRSDVRRKRHFAWKLSKHFGISVEQYEEFMRRQAGCCAICLQPPDEAKGHKNKPRLHVDHDHKTGRVRGLLCNSCNAGLGYFRDDIELLLSAADYLSRSLGDDCL